MARWFRDETVKVANTAIQLSGGGNRLLRRLTGPPLEAPRGERRCRKQLENVERERFPYVFLELFSATAHSQGYLTCNL